MKDLLKAMQNPKSNVAPPTKLSVALGALRLIGGFEAGTALDYSHGRGRYLDSHYDKDRIAREEKAREDEKWWEDQKW
jgi:hypothetical protein